MIVDLSKYSNLWIIEGNDGVGKTTMINSIVTELNSEGIYSIRIPFNMSKITASSIDIGRKLNYNIATNTYLHLASLADQILRLVVPALEEGKVVFLDRYVYSIVARGKVRNFSYEIEDWERNFNSPNNIVYIETDSRTALSRKKDTNSPVTYWEAGQDIFSSLNVEDSFIKFQSEVLHQFNSILPEKVHKINSTEFNLSQRSEYLLSLVKEKVKKDEKNSGNNRSK